MFKGATAFSDDVKPDQVLSSRALALYPQVDTKCLGALDASDSFGGEAPASLIRDGADLNPLLKVLDEQENPDLKITVPVLLLQGLSDSTVLVAGGLGTKPGGAPSFLDNAELYTPKKNKWRSAAESTMSVSRGSHTATLLLDDTVLVVGGQLLNDSVANADLYLPNGFAGALSQK